jgi:hypothetical protein
MKKQFLLIAILFFVSIPLFAITQDTSGGFDVSQLVALLNPVLVYFAIQLAKKITSINSTVILAVLVPGVSLLGSYLLSLVVSDGGFLLTFLIGFASTFVYELQKQLSGS